ncbi:trigger factor [Candidatus Peregrinibacteria bacterium]|nr:trigger factor [Candidatus Peregrinibacteria bacterium]
MKITVTRLPKSEVKLTVEVFPEEWDKARTEILKKLISEMTFPGYRRGKAPASLVEQKIGEGEIWMRTSEQALVSTYPQVILDEKLSVMCRPKIEIISRDPFKYEAHVAIFPDIETKDLLNIRIPEKEVAVSDSEVAEVLENMRKERALYEAVDRGAENGDRVELSFEGFDEQGVKLDGAGSKRHPFFFGEGMLVPDFEKNILGMKKGEHTDFSIVFPKEYRHKPFAEKKVRFEVEVLSVEKRLLPEVTPEFIEKVFGEKMEIPSFEAKMRENLLSYKTKGERKRREDELFVKLLEACPFEVSPLVLDEEIDNLESEITIDFKKQGVDYASYRKAMEGKGENLRNNLKKRAENRIRTRCIVGRLVDTLKINVSEEEVKKALEQEKDTPIEVVRNYLIFQKLLDYFLKSAP